MKDKTVYKLSIMFALIGITAVYASSSYMAPETVKIGDIDNSMQGEKVRISGEIEEYYRSDGNLFLEVSDDSGEISVADFDTEAKVGAADAVNVTGEVSLYEGELEIIAEEVQRAGGRKP